MDSLASLFELIVIGITAFSVASLVGFILWDSLVDAKHRGTKAATVHELAASKPRMSPEPQRHFAQAA